MILTSWIGLGKFLRRDFVTLASDFENRKICRQVELDFSLSHEQLAQKYNPGIKNFTAGVSHQNCIFAQFWVFGPRLLGVISSVCRYADWKLKSRMWGYQAVDDRLNRLDTTPN